MNMTPSPVPRAAIIARPIVLARAPWERSADGRGVRATRGTWHAFKHRGDIGSVIVPMISCPNCGGLTYVVPTFGAALQLKRMGVTYAGQKDPSSLPHSVDRIGKVTANGPTGPGVLCGHGRCDFHRIVILDRWQDEKPLWVIVYTDGNSFEPQFQYCHAVNKSEALHHFGALGRRTIIETAPAVGYFTDERTGRQTV